ncbi:MAG: hypothetical protein WC378_16180 [Opitutaceae bacterium]|jgi:hypothetical protein
MIVSRQKTRMKEACSFNGAELAGSMQEALVDAKGKLTLKTAKVPMPTKHISALLRGGSTPQRRGDVRTKRNGDRSEVVMLLIDSRGGGV